MYMCICQTSKCVLSFFPVLCRSTTPASNGIVTSTVDSATSLSRCPQLICTFEYIPAECREFPVITINGQQCSGCQQWKAECKSKNIEILKSDVTSASPSASSLCPQTICTLEFIPAECKEIPTIAINGLNCEGCPRWRDGCKEQAASSVTTDQKNLPQVACPILDCGVPIPTECKVQRTHTTQGQVCELCPDWREGCRESEHKAYLENPKGSVTAKCPAFICDENIPVQCQEIRSFPHKGNTCYGCPTWRLNCKVILPIAGLSGRIAAPMTDPTCPEIKCRTLPGLHRTCMQREFYTLDGKTCERCASIKPRCQNFEPTRPFLPSRPQVNSGGGIMACPLLACPTVNIPKECSQIEKFEINGRMCDACPTFIKGCVANDQSGALVNKPIQTLTADLACPLKACTMMLIPPECREEQTFTVNGKVCPDCPRWREGCVANEGLNTLPEVACPMVACTRIYIPKECREETPYQFQGKTCYRCPKWRQSCRPGNNNTPKVLPIPFRPQIADVACPLMKCAQINAPKECIVQQTFESNGKSCTGCPQVREDCPQRMRDSRICPQVMCPNMRNIPKECLEMQEVTLRGVVCQTCPRVRPGCKKEPILMTVDTKEASTAPPTTTTTTKGSNRVPIPMTVNNNPRDSSILDLNGVIPVRDIISRMNNLSCPPLPCSDMLIPYHCKVETMYQYQGRTCRGCPRWRLGCQPNAVDPFTINPNGYVPTIHSFCVTDDKIYMYNNKLGPIIEF